jgi:thiol-disulfide isomerase/thioredoxin
MRRAAPVPRGIAVAIALAACRSSAPPPSPPPEPAAAAPTDEPPARAAAPPGPGAPERVPYDEDTRDVIGKPAPGWDLPRWFNSPPLTLEALRGKVILVRWIMSPECPFCSGTAPSLNRLHADYHGQGLVVIGMYHHKRSEALDPEDVRGYVEHYGFQFPVAIDEDWRTLRRFWLDGHERREFTSVSFIIDRRGVIRDVHKGGKYAPGDADYERIRGRIEALLGEPGG